MLLFAVGNLYFVLLNMATIIVLLSRASTLWLCVPLQFSFPFTVPPCSTPPTPPQNNSLLLRESSSTSVTITAGRRLRRAGLASKMGYAGRRVGCCSGAELGNTACCSPYTNYIFPVWLPNRSISGG